MGMNWMSWTSSFAAAIREFGGDALVHRLVVADEVHLVHCHHDVRDAQQGRDEGVAVGLLDDPVAGIDEHDGQVGGGGAGDHVAGVLHMARGVGDDELALGRGEVAVGHVDGDALLALGPEAVGEEGQVDLVVAASDAGALDGLQLVFEDALGVVQQAADERGLAVIDRAGGGEAKQVHARSSLPSCGLPWPSR